MISQNPFLHGVSGNYYQSRLVPAYSLTCSLCNHLCARLFQEISCPLSSNWVCSEAFTENWKVGQEWCWDIYSYRSCHGLSAFLYWKTQLLSTSSSIPETGHFWLRGDNRSPIASPRIIHYPLSVALNLSHIFVGKVFHRLPNLSVLSCFLPGPDWYSMWIKTYLSSLSYITIRPHTSIYLLRLAYFRSQILLNFSPSLYSHSQNSSSGP